MGERVIDEQHIADFFKAIAHPTRINILRTIHRNNYCVNDISDRLHLNQPNTSQHLSILKEKNIIQKTKNGNEVCYRIRNVDVIKLLEEAERIISQLKNE
jgi:DNA-binding transcriptional ArsR family regulator